MEKLKTNLSTNGYNGATLMLVKNRSNLVCVPEYACYQLTQIVFHPTFTRLLDDSKHETSLRFITTRSSKSSPRNALSHYWKLITANSRGKQIKEAARMDGGDAD